MCWFSGNRNYRVKTVYSSPNLALVNHFKNILEGCDIPCQIRKEYLSGGAGELPLMDCWPELCVADDGLFAEASRLIEEALSPEGERGVEWKCSDCGKTIERQFTECWNCGGSRPEQ
jgi:hypothetical protein